MFQQHGTNVRSGFWVPSTAAFGGRAPPLGKSFHHLASPINMYASNRAFYDGWAVNWEGFVSARTVVLNGPRSDCAEHDLCIIQPFARSH